MKKMANRQQRSNQEHISLLSTNVLKNTICDYVLKSLQYFRHDYVPVVDSFQLLELPEPIKRYIDHHFTRNRAIWRDNVLIYHVPEQPGLVLTIQKRHAFDQTWIRIRPFTTTSNDRPKRTSTSSSSSSSTTNSTTQIPLPFVPGIFNESYTPMNSPHAPSRLKKPSRRRELQRCRNIFLPQLINCYDLYQDERNELEDILKSSTTDADESEDDTNDKKIKKNDKKIKKNDDTNNDPKNQSSSETSVPKRSAPEITDIQLLELALTNGSQGQALRRTGYGYVKQEIQILEKNTKHSNIALATTILVKELRQLNTAEAKGTANQVLCMIMSIVNPTTTNPLEQSFAQCLYQSVILNGGRRQYIKFRNSQRRSGKTGINVLMPHHRLAIGREGRRPIADLDGKFVPPVPMTRANAGQDRNVVVPFMCHGPGGLLIIPRPANARVPYCPSVFWRIKSVFNCIMRQEVYPVIEAFFSENELDISEHALVIVIMGGGDGSGMDTAKSSKATTHLLAYGITLTFVIAIPLDNYGIPVECDNLDHKDYDNCSHCNQRRVYSHPNTQSPYSHRIIGLSMGDENHHDQKKLFKDIINYELKDILNDGYTYNSKLFGVELIESRIDEKWKSDTQYHHPSTSYVCLLCDCAADEIKPLSKLCRCYTPEERREKRQKATAARKEGKSQTEVLEAGNGYDGSSVSQFLYSQKHDSSVQGLHAQIAIGGRMMLHLLTLTCLNDNYYYVIQRKEWTAVRREKFKVMVKKVKGAIAAQFGSNLGLRSDGKLARITMDPSKHGKLIALFASTASLQRKMQLEKILKDMATIMKITRSTFVPAIVAETFKARCVEWSDFLDVCFPTLPWPRYMHFLISHGQEMILSLGSIGLWSEEASEHCNKLLKYNMKWLSRPNMDDMLVDVMRRMWDRGDPLLRQFEFEEDEKI